MSDAYSNVVGGSLKLKGKGKSGKKRKHTEADARGEDAAAGAGPSSAAAAAAGNDEGAEALAEPQLSTLTKAQQDYLRAHERNARRKGEEQKSKTYRDKIAAMNEYLSNLSEHNDVPRITKH